MNTNTENTFHDAIIHAVQAEQVAETAKAQKGVVSQELMELARDFVSGSELIVGTAPNGKKAERGEPTGFLGACYEAEQFIKSEEAGQWRVEKVPTCFGVAKSRIKRAFTEFGLLPSDFETESEMRKAVNEAIANAKEAENALSGVDVTEDNATLITRLNTLYTIGERLEGDDLESFMEVLDNTITEYKLILDALVPVEPTADSEANVA